MVLNESVLHIPSGYLFSSGTAGIKESGASDVAFAEAPGEATAAAMFTTNRIAAAPVIVGREHLRRSSGRVRAIIVNSGNANCATGHAGESAAILVCERVGQALSAPVHTVVPSSTGIIGVPLPFEKILVTLPRVISSRACTPDSVMGFANAIMTTDKRPKVSSAFVGVNGGGYSLLGVAKGAGMIHPNLATMLVYLFTDAVIQVNAMQELLRAAVNESFNHISIDGDTSTNDTVLLLASGTSHCMVDDVASQSRFAEALRGLCADLAEKIVADGEGVNHVIALTVHGAEDNKAADQIARTVGNSQLVKTAWAGADPNWGRMLAAAGRSGVSVSVNLVRIWIGDIEVFRHGTALPFDQNAARRTMQLPRYSIRIEVGNGNGRSSFLTGDMTEEYVRINADYST